MWLEKLKAMKAGSGLTTKEIAERAKIPEPTLEKIFAGATKDPKLTTIQQLVHFLGYSLDDLDDIRHGMEKAPSDISEEAKQLAQDYDQRLDSWGKKAVRGLADLEMARVAVVPVTDEEPEKPPVVHETASSLAVLPKARHRRDGFIEIKVYTQPAAAGLGNYLDEPDYHMEQYPGDQIPDRVDFGVLISGDSMEPEIRDGATVFVQSCSTIDPGQTGIFILDGKAYCKRLVVDQQLRQVRLVSVNPAYEDIPIRANDEFRTLGRVLGQYVPRTWPR